MYHGANLPIIGEFANPTLLAELAVQAEHAGWDGVFVWDTLLFDVETMPPVVDPWVVLAAIATSTTRVKIGPMIAQVARRRPWEVARQVITLDHLSHGRFILGAGLGYAGEADFGHFGLPADARARADLLDESLHIIAGLCSGEPFEHQGRYHTIRKTLFRPSPVQHPVPVWIGGYWPHKRPMRRAARWHGAFPARPTTCGNTPPAGSSREPAAAPPPGPQPGQEGSRCDMLGAPLLTSPFSCRCARPGHVVGLYMARKPLHCPHAPTKAGRKRTRGEVEELPSGPLR